MAHHSTFFQDVIEGFRHLVVTAHQSGIDFAELELPPGILQGAVERDAFVGVGDVIAMILGLYGHQRADGVVRRLHEIGGLQHLLAVVGERIQEKLSVFDAAIARPRDDGIHGVQTCFFQCLLRRGQGAFHDFSHAPRLDGRHIFLEARVDGTGEGNIVRYGFLHPRLGQRLLEGDLLGREDKDAVMLRRLRVLARNDTLRKNVIKARHCGLDPQSPKRLGITATPSNA